MYHEAKRCGESPVRLRLRAEAVLGHDAVPDSPVAVGLNAKVVGATDDAEPSVLAPVGAPAVEGFREEGRAVRCGAIKENGKSKQMCFSHLLRQSQ